MGSLIAEKDWSTTSLGPIADWSPSLRTALAICLESRFPMVVHWGPDYIYLYNDAVIPLLGQRHPYVLGLPYREAWPDIWETIHPILARVVSGDSATWTENWQLTVERYGYPEVCFATISFSPIRDTVAGGAVAGILATFLETTPAVLAARRLACLREIGAAMSGRRGRRAVCRAAATVLDHFRDDLPFGAILIQEPQQRRPLRAMATWGLEDAHDALGILGVFDPSPPHDLASALASGRVRVVERLPEPLLGGLCASPPPRGIVIWPFVSHRSKPPIGLLIAGVGRCLGTDLERSDFVELVANQISTAVVRAGLDDAQWIATAEARRSARHDGLTGLPNREVLLDRLRRAMCGIGQDRDRVCLLFIDLDGFKAVNDTLGHQAGDDVLCEVALILTQTVSRGDTVARIAGDEFAILRPVVAGMAPIRALADSLVHAVNLTKSRYGQVISVTASVGVALSGEALSDSGRLMIAADTAMYEAKRHGGGRYAIFDELSPELRS
ncbi:hypothetical protein CcI49_18365 [Frankia sp. CcI49]|nr:hypothetical protein CcI49_18365 [Frankia sp. CcI49]